MTNNPNPTSTLRSAFVAALQRAEKFTAIREAKALLTEDPGLRQISFICRELEKLSYLKLDLKRLKVALLSSFSIDFIRQPLIVQSFLSGIDVSIYLAGFGQYQQEIRDPNSGLYAFSPDVVVLALEGADYLPEIYNNYLDGLSRGFDATLLRLQEDYQSLIQTFREHSAATLLINNFAPPIQRKLGILDGQEVKGQAQLVEQMNESLATFSRKNSSVYAVDYASLVSRHGAMRWYDERMTYYAKAPIAMDMLPHLAGEYVKFCRALTGQTKKCLVIDLDNTLWGGVLGEDGVAGIQLGSVYPGSAYLEFQREILNLHKRGVILAIASKNNASDVEEVFASHRGMLLKRQHFACMQIHWGQKSESLREIARQLNIGLEHIVFVDDNPAEIREVEQNLTMVTTIKLPKQPETFVRTLLENGLFDSLAFSAEDRRRAELYRQRDEAETLRERSGSIEDFYRSLDMEVALAQVEKSSLARSAQMTQKTNQFNITTIRFSESELVERMKNPDWLLITTSVRDRFGDNGIVGLMMARFFSGILDIETFLLSCRVIGRGVETAMLAYLCEQAARRGTGTIQGRIIPTAKNVPVRDLFEKHRFEKLDETKTGETRWMLNLNEGPVPWPHWLTAIRDAVATQD
jgi:FkbH-like protein